MQIGCHKRDPLTLLLCDDHSGDDQDKVSINVWRIRMFRLNTPASDKRSSVQETPPSTRILVIGAGYAGLLFTLRLAGKVARQHVQIALVNESDTFTERPRLHQFATNQVVPWRSLPQMLRRNDKPVPPYFTGRLGYLIREGFVRYLAAATQRPGIYVWVGKRRYERSEE